MAGPDLVLVYMLCLVLFECEPDICECFPGSLTPAVTSHKIDSDATSLHIRFRNAKAASERRSLIQSRHPVPALDLTEQGRVHTGSGSNLTQRFPTRFAKVPEPCPKINNRIAFHMGWTIGNMTGIVNTWRQWQWRGKGGWRQGSDMRRPGQVVGGGLQCPCKADEGNERDVVLTAFDHSHVGGMTRDAFAKLFLCQVQGQTALANSRTQAACSG